MEEDKVGLTHKGRDTSGGCILWTDISIVYNGKASGGYDSKTTMQSHGWREQSLEEPVWLSARQVHSGRYPGYLSDRRVIYKGNIWFLEEAMTCGSPLGSRVESIV